MGKAEQEVQNATPSRQHEGKKSVDSANVDLPYSHQQTISGNAQDKLEQVEIENRIMKAKISEMESYINTMSTAGQSNGPGGQISELREMKMMFEDKLLQLQKENNEKEQFFI